MTSKSTISVAMCTYNGERYLPRQLASILGQTRLPDEVIVRDDRSTDGTPALIEAFRQQAPFPVDFKINTRNLGAKKNFEQAIFACHGQFIALSDQDDIWHRERLARSEQELINHPEAGLVFTDGNVIDDYDRPTGGSLWKSFYLDRRSLEFLQAGNWLPLAQRTFVTGATVMFRAPLARLCFPTGDQWWHDGWLAMLIAAMGAVRPIDAPLISYRIHAAQQLGLGEANRRPWKTLEERATQQAASMRQVRDSLIEVCEAIARLSLSGQHCTVEAYRRHADFLAMRLSLPKNRLSRIPIMLNAIEEYRTCGSGVLSMLRDFILPKVPDQVAPGPQDLPQDTLIRDNAG